MIHLSSHFQVFQALYQSFDERTERCYYNWCHRHLSIPWFSKILLQGLHNYLSFPFLSILLSGLPGWQSPIFGRFSFSFSFCCYWLLLNLVACPRLGDLSVSQNPSEFLRCILQYGFWVLQIPFVHMVKFQFLAQIFLYHLLHAVVSSLTLVELISCICLLYNWPFCLHHQYLLFCYVS